MRWIALFIVAGGAAVAACERGGDPRMHSVEYALVVESRGSGVSPDDPDVVQMGEWLDALSRLCDASRAELREVISNAREGHRRATGVDIDAKTLVPRLVRLAQTGAGSGLSLSCAEVAATAVSPDR
jgi:hypothetical protein